MGRTLGVVAIALASACGRLGFDATGGDGAAGGSDGPVGGGDGPVGDPDGAVGGADAPDLTGVNVAFVTSTTVVPSSLGGLAGADGVCSTRAGAAGLSGTFRAYVAVTGTSAISRLGSARGWVRRDGRPFVDTTADLAAGRLFYPLRIDELGGDVGTAALAATGASGNGAPSGTNCSDFAGGGSVTYGSPHAGDVFWSTNGTTPCTDPIHLYCFGVDAVQAVAPPEVGSNRLAFRAVWTSAAGGLAAADTACQTAAGNAGLGGSYKALIGLTTATAASRFSASGANWVRPDGIALASSPSAFLGGELLAPIVLDLAGGSASVLVATGSAPNELPLTNENCNDWTSNGGNVMLGLSIYSGLPGYERMSFGCIFVGNVYCLQE